MKKPKEKRKPRREYGPAEGLQMMRGLADAARKFAAEEAAFKGKLATEVVQ
jgi:hypothetical protein